jgi:hypothetical protein
MAKNRLIFYINIFFILISLFIMLIKKESLKHTEMSVGGEEKLHFTQHNKAVWEAKNSIFDINVKIEELIKEHLLILKSYNFIQSDQKYEIIFHKKDVIKDYDILDSFYKNIDIFLQKLKQYDFNSIEIQSSDSFDQKQKQILLDFFANKIIYYKSIPIKFVFTNKLDDEIKIYVKMKNDNL